MEVIQALAQTLERELGWFQHVVDIRLKNYFSNSNTEIEALETPPNITNDASKYAKECIKHNLDPLERLVLILALIPHLKPNALDVFLIKNQNLSIDFVEFGGIRTPSKPGFLPTLETACFIVGGSQLIKRFLFLDQISLTNVLFKNGILKVNENEEFGLKMSLQVSAEYLSLFTTGEKALPEHSTSFPAKVITTQLDATALIVDDSVHNSLAEISQWVIHAPKILHEWGLKKNLKPGYSALFYGPPGTGKTLAATLLGKATERPVYRVDLSMIVSKYIGETEKNIRKLFDEAAHKNWILYFDEADALFGKRTQTKDANDKYANQEVAYLLQRIEDFSGLVILATNFYNIDDTFARRFQTMIYFAKPGKEQRKLLWKQLFESNLDLESDIDIDKLSENHELTGGEMINILRHCALEAAKRGQKTIFEKDIITGIRREFSKQNKTL
ncbi:ATP-binding protein [Rasiella rasia]|uniref:ATP-binding protein n=1 Tax=Rasiella rasia TaxID=2744027 RepID=A0A6G6GMZ5_9FLAO|nr:ATP-binding protein [Rasiella rasia]QIE59783.1 ATP-binding protein [Rasiella rasia]